MKYVLVALLLLGCSFIAFAWTKWPGEDAEENFSLCLIEWIGRAILRIDFVLFVLWALWPFWRGA